VNNQVAPPNPSIQLSHAFGDFLTTLGVLLDLLPKNLSDGQAKLFRRDVAALTNRWFGTMVRDYQDKQDNRVKSSGRLWS
jgi:hypothetical protein